MKQRTYRHLFSIMGLVLALTLGAIQPAAAADSTWKSPFLAIVWPHDGSGNGTPVASSKAVNISVWPSNSVSCSVAPSQSLTLWRAKNNDPITPVDKTPQFFLRTAGNVRFPSLEFNDVPADIASNTSNRYYFMLGGWQGNVWVDATDARTYLPYAVQPSGFTDKTSPAIDARIQIVYPHDPQGNLADLSTATLDNVAVDLFEHGTVKSVPVAYAGGTIVLYMAEANQPMGIAQKANGSAATVSLEPYKLNGVTYPRWVFNDVKVVPGRQYHFLVRVQGVDTYPTVWTHSKDVRTYLPNPPAPPACDGQATQPPPSPTPCPTDWFTDVAQPGSCPTAGAKQVKAAYEPFQHGHMIWRDGLGFDILESGAGIWEGWPNNLTTCRDTSGSVHPPSGLFAPVSGFGLIWRGDADYCTYTNPDDFDHNHFRKILGWATAAEAGYTATYQSGSKTVQSTNSSGAVVQLTSLYTYITLPDGKIVELSRLAQPNQFTYFRILNP